jgi:hypothetical protein
MYCPLNYTILTGVCIKIATAALLKRCVYFFDIHLWFKVNSVAILIICIGNPKALVNTMWLNCTMHFGLRGRHELTQILWGDIVLKTDTSGVGYLEFHERSTKTR